MTVYALLRYAVVVLYVVMGVWLIGAGIHRAYSMAIGATPPDPAPFASCGIGLFALLLLAATIIVRVVGTRRRTR